MWRVSGQVFKGERFSLEMLSQDECFSRLRDVMKEKQSRHAKRGKAPTSHSRSSYRPWEINSHIRDRKSKTIFSPLVIPLL